MVLVFCGSFRCPCVCVCACMEWLVAISLQSAGSLQEKRIDLFRFLTDNLNLNEFLCPNVLSTAWGIVTRIESRNERGENYAMSTNLFELLCFPSTNCPELHSNRRSTRSLFLCSRKRARSNFDDKNKGLRVGS